MKHGVRCETFETPDGWMVRVSLVIDDAVAEAHDIHGFATFEEADSWMREQVLGGRAKN